MIKINKISMLYFKKKNAILIKIDHIAHFKKIIQSQDMVRLHIQVVEMDY